MISKFQAFLIHPGMILITDSGISRRVMDVKRWRKNSVTSHVFSFEKLRPSQYRNPWTHYWYHDIKKWCIADDK